MKVGKTPAQALGEERDRLLAELEALQNKIQGLELAIKLISDEAVELDSAPRRDRSISETIRLLLAEAGGEGLSVDMVLNRAAARGSQLNRTSVSSLLSRMKRDGEVDYRKRRYVLRARE